jgi:hypothetical protein
MRKGHVRLQVGREIVDFGSVIPKEFRELQVAQQEYPLRLPKIGERRYWEFRDRIYWENEDLTADEVYALLVSRQQRDRGRIERAQAMVAMGMRPQDQAQRRDVIPDDVKQMVWMRDGGRCRQCSAQVELQFDHITPFAMGGGSNPENLQILCGPCNRRKSAGLTIRILFLSLADEDIHPSSIVHISDYIYSGLALPILGSPPAALKTIAEYAATVAPGAAIIASGGVDGIGPARLAIGLGGQIFWIYYGKPVMMVTSQAWTRWLCRRLRVPRKSLESDNHDMSLTDKD